MTVSFVKKSLSASSPIWLGIASFVTTCSLIESVHRTDIASVAVHSPATIAATMPVAATRA